MRCSVLPCEEESAFGKIFLKGEREGVQSSRSLEMKCELRVFPACGDGCVAALEKED